ncbi:MAG: glycosyltransferase family 4 protein, partial [Acidobacteria bacterium]|nr:glycosyltransferase family 4 protein [Acidobacteriota bacterium]
VHVAAQRVDIRSPLPPGLHVYMLMPESDTSILDRLIFMLRMRLLFRRLSRGISFDLVHQMNPVFTGLSLSLVGTRPPLVLGTFVPRWQSGADGVVSHVPLLTRAKQWMLDTLARIQQAQAAGLLIASPEAIERIAAPHRGGTRIFEVPHGIDLSRFPPRDRVPARPSILFLANVIRRKGIFTLLDAFERVAAVMPDAELVIAGGGGDLAEVESRVAELPALRIRLMGRVDRADVPALMRQHSVYCLPSYGEPFATSILEAMACGLPVVATRAGGLPHLVSDAGGRLVPPRDVDGLADALLEILSSRTLQEAMGRHNRARVENEFEAETAVDRLEEAYVSVLHGARHHEAAS